LRLGFHLLLFPFFPGFPRHLRLPFPRPSSFLPPPSPFFFWQPPCFLSARPLNTPNPPPSAPVCPLSTFSFFPLYYLPFPPSNHRFRLRAFESLIRRLPLHNTCFPNSARWVLKEFSLFYLALSAFFPLSPAFSFSPYRFHVPFIPSPLLCRSFSPPTPPRDRHHSGHQVLLWFLLPFFFCFLRSSSLEIFPLPIPSFNFPLFFFCIPGSYLPHSAACPLTQLTR